MAQVSRLINRKSMELAAAAILSLAVLYPRTGLCDISDATNIWPLFYYEEDADLGLLEWHALGPIVSYSREPEGRLTGVRPLYTCWRDEPGDEWDLKFLWPIGKYEESDAVSAFRLLPLYYHIALTKPDGEVDTDYALFPFVFGGSSEPDEESYFALFPLGGRVRGLLGVDEIRFFLFPLYSHTIEEDYERWNFLWPIVAHTTGPGRDGFRVWPFYGRVEKPGSFSHTFWFWPFYNRTRLQPDSEFPIDKELFFPFYASEDGPRRRVRAVLWPLFSHTVNWEQDIERWDAPWPVLRYAEGPDLHMRHFWPFVGYRREGRSESSFVLWPLCLSWRDRAEEYESSRRWVLPIYFGETKRWFATDNSARYLRLWPLFDYTRDEDGGKQFNLLSLWWFRDPDGFERNYAPLWRIYQYREDGTGSRSNFLWRLYQRERRPGYKAVEIPYLFSYRNVEGVEKEISFLKGLVRLRKAGERWAVKLLFRRFRHRNEAGLDSHPRLAHEAVE